MKKVKGLRKRWYMLRDLLGIPSKKYNYKNNYIKNDNNFKNIKNIDNIYKFYGQFKPQVDEFIFKRYFNDINIKGVCIECGALDGLTDSSCKFFEETMKWKSYNFEPNPYNFKKLKENRPNSINLNLAMSNIDGEFDFNFELVKDENNNICCAGNGSLIKYTEEQTKSIKDVYKNDVDVIKVKTITYKNFINQNQIKHIDLFVLDVEGNELNVLDGMKDCEILPDIMTIEINNEDNFFIIRNKMEELGYLYDITSFCNYYFVKKETISLINLRKNLPQL